MEAEQYPVEKLNEETVEGSVQAGARRVVRLVADANAEDGRQEEPSVIRVAEIQRTIEDAIALAKWHGRKEVMVSTDDGLKSLSQYVFGLYRLVVSGEISIDQFEILRQTYAPTDKELTSHHEVPQGSPAPTQAGTPTVPPAESSPTSGGEDGYARRRHRDEVDVGRRAAGEH